MEYRTEVERRDPVLVVILSIVTCGIYLIFWYARIYDELITLTGKTPTGNTFILDFLLFFLTLGVWGIYVDYRISHHLNDLQEERGMTVNDTAALVVVLDVAAYFTIAFTSFLSSAIQQDLLNRMMERQTKDGSEPKAADANTPPVSEGPPSGGATGSHPYD